MSNIPASRVVNTTLSVSAILRSAPGFGTLNIVTSETGVIGRAERLRSYSTIDGVTSDWGASTEVVACATSYFSQVPKPTSLVVSTRYETDQSAQLRGGGVSDLAPLLLVSDGSFTVSIDGVEEDITGLDFTDGEVTGADIAATIQTALQAVAAGGFTLATCVYSNSRFFIESGTTGVSSTISFASPVTPTAGTDISSLIKMRMGEAILVAGIAGETISESLSAIENANPGWNGLVFTKEVRDLVIINGESSVLAAANWCEARVKVFFNTTNSIDALDSVSETHIGFILKSNNIRRTMTTFSSHVDQYPSASAAGRAFTVNFEGTNTTISLNFKQLPGITVESLTTNQLDVLQNNRINTVVDIGGIILFTDSSMASGVFFDEVHGLDWLNNRVTTDAFSTILTTPTFTDKGVASIEQSIIGSLAQAVRNGLGAPGTLSNGEFLASGFKTEMIPVADVSQVDIDNRIYRGASFVLKGAGAIHGLEIVGTFER